MKFKFGKISEIDINDENTWKDKIFITLDIDWAPDYVIRYAHKLLSNAGVVSTWFVTHESDALKDLKADENIELGIHPNFNPLLLQGSHVKGKNASEVIAVLQKLVPYAKSIRSHSLSQSSPLLDLFFQHGFTHECNLYLPYHNGWTIKPYSHWNSLIRAPHIWEDDVAMLEGDHPDNSFEEILKFQGLKILGFHPTHIYLNSNDQERYDKIKMNLNDEELFWSGRNNVEKGTETFLNFFLSK